MSARPGLPRRTRLVLALAALTTGLLACRPDNTLWGSVSELFPLDVSRVDVRRNDQALQISYFANRGADIDLVARVVVRTDGLELAGSRAIPLEGFADEAGIHPRTTVAHVAAGEPVRVLPLVSDGELILSELGEIGEPVRGTLRRCPSCRGRPTAPAAGSAGRSPASCWTAASARRASRTPGTP